MRRHNIVGIICPEFYVWLLLNTATVQSIFRPDHIKIKEYFVGSSKVYSAKQNSKLVKRDVRVNSRPEFLFNLQLYNDGRPFTIYIRQRDSDILADKTIFLNIFNVTDIGYNSSTMDFGNQSHLYEGYVTEFPDDSSANGYIKDDNFYGHLIINNTVYYIDELRDSDKRWNVDLPDGTIAQRNALIFKRDSVTIGMLLGETPSARVLFQQLVKQNYFYKEFQNWKGNGMLCPIIVVIDNSFLTVVHNGNQEAAIFQVLFSMEEANAVFRSTDIDGDGTPDNIGFYVKKIVVITTGETQYFIPEYHSEMILVNDYLVKFIRYQELPDYCLGVVFTAQKFDKGTLGASYTPDSTSLHPTSGICEGYHYYVGTLNGLVITASTFRTSLVNQLVFEVTIIHELGHSFGSLHDEAPECFGHVMSPRSFADYNANRTHVVFSPCSRDHILRILVMKGSCLEPVQTSFCGNGIVEDDEDCDCGLTRDCLQKDPCCIPRRTKEYPCKINKKMGFECHPSQGKCCTKDCKYSTSLENFVNCRNFDRTCPCPKKHCTCGLNGECIQDECHSIECARLQLKECPCETKALEKICQVCCQYQNSCLTATKAANAVLSSAEKRDVVVTTLSEHGRVVPDSKQFVSKSFCFANECVTMPFFQGDSGAYCLSRGKLGRCRTSLQCKIFKSKQSFPSFEPSFESAGAFKFTLDVLNMICYMIMNSFLIYVFY